MPTCSFCKKNYSFPRGLTIFTIDGRRLYYCSSKCKRNFELKRDPKKVNWIKREKKVKKSSSNEEKIETNVNVKKEVKDEVKKEKIESNNKKSEENKKDSKKED
jgi:large subunit ribosomal protein L24e